MLYRNAYVYIGLCCILCVTVVPVRADTHMVDFDKRMVIADGDGTVKDVCREAGLSECQCCCVEKLVRRKPWMHDNPEETFREVVRQCFGEEACGEQVPKTWQAIIESELTKQNLLSDKPEHEEQQREIIAYIVREYFPIKDVPVNDQDVDEKGHLTEQGVRNVLMYLCDNAYLRECNFTKNTQVEDVFKSIKGWQTDQLFKISPSRDEHASYLLKGIPLDDGLPIEAFALQSLKYTELNSIILPNEERNMPSLVIPHAYIRYEAAGKVHYLSLMPQAPGKAVMDYIKDYFNNDLSHDELLSMYTQLGYHLGRFHKRFAEEECARYVYPHGDLHAKNIFYDTATQKVTYIDNDQLAQMVSRDTYPILRKGRIFVKEGIDRRTPIKDIKILWDTLHRWDDRPEQSSRFMKDTVQAFMDGYMKAWGDQADCVKRTITGKDACLDKLLNRYSTKGCQF